MDRKPFHETIIDLINKTFSAAASESLARFIKEENGHDEIIAFGAPASNALMWLATFIKSTTIENGHDEIIAAWQRGLKEGDYPEDHDFGVITSLLEQKQDAITKAENDQKGISLDELQQEADKLLKLLDDRHPGTFVWNMFMMERLKNIRRIIGTGK